MAVAKGIGGGFPMGACLATREAAKGMTAGTHGSTFGGNPLAMAVGNAVLDVVLAPGFLDEVKRKALLLKQHLAGLLDRHPDVVSELRGDGLLLGLKCRPPVGDVIEALRRRKLLAISAGENVLRLAPPLVVADSDIDEAVSIIDAAFAELGRSGMRAAG
jgi:acetylornithine/N-succinyldiaminopimelate aminotransferase